MTTKKKKFFYEAFPKWWVAWQSDLLSKPLVVKNLLSSESVVVIAITSLLISIFVEPIFADSGLSAVRLRTAIPCFFLCALILSLSVIFISYLRENVVTTLRDLMVISTNLVFSAVIVSLFVSLRDALALTYSGPFASYLFYAAPVAAGGMILQITLGLTGVFVYVLSFSLIANVFVSGSWLFGVMVVVSNLIGALSVSRCKSRAVYLNAGLRIGALNLLVAFCYFLLYPSVFNEVPLASLLALATWSLVGAMFSVMLAASLTPVYEYLSSHISDMTLLELGSMDCPLLQELSLRAPGTWNHSLVVAQLGEAAATEIGANGLLVRVGSYYHDIGKMKKPQYFTENQGQRDDRHEKLTASMSALIIKAHVKDGVELAKQHGLPAALIRFIKEHHGTSLIKFFYDKAQSEAGEDEQVQEENYRYPGPKPQTKETAIAMLADATEAASRSLKEPTPAKIKGLVQKIINGIFVSGELEESPLTLKDLHLVAKSFTRVLNGIYHSRIEYPDPVEKGSSKVVQMGKGQLELVEQNRNASRDSNKTDGPKSREQSPGSGENPEEGGEALKRLGS